jgi:hypothetical protein
MRFVPLGFTDASLHRAWFGRFVVARLRFGPLVAPRTGMIGCRLLGMLRRLPLQGLLKHVFGEHFTQCQEHILDFGESGTPNRSLGPVEAIDEVLGNPVQISAHGIEFRPGVLGVSHPWLLSCRVAVVKDWREFSTNEANQANGKQAPRQQLLRKTHCETG